MKMVVFDSFRYCWLNSFFSVFLIFGRFFCNICI